MNHRIKDNLQVVSSLLHLQGARSNGRRTRQALAACESRVRSIALLYELIAEMSKPLQIDLARYAERLMERLESLHNPGARSIALRWRADSVELPLAQAMPFALVLHELAVNALLHAFPSGGPGEICVSIARAGARVELTVRDDGRGWDTAGRREGLGMDLVRTLVDQFRGRLEVNARGDGTAVRIAFPAGSQATGES